MLQGQDHERERGLKGLKQLDSEHDAPLGDVGEHLHAAPFAEQLQRALLVVGPPEGQLDQAEVGEADALLQRGRQVLDHPFGERPVERGEGVRIGEQQIERVLHVAVRPLQRDEGRDRFEAHPHERLHIADAVLRVGLGVAQPVQQDAEGHQVGHERVLAKLIGLLQEVSVRRDGFQVALEQEIGDQGGSIIGVLTLEQAVQAGSGCATG